MAQKDNTAFKNWPKHLLQWSVLTILVLLIAGIIPADKLFSPKEVFPLGGLESIAIWIAGGNVPVASNILQMTIGLIIAASAMLFGKLFCGYICPLGTLQELISKIRTGLHIKQISIRNGSIADLILRIFKYGLLFWIFYSSITAGKMIYNHLDPYYTATTGFGDSSVMWMSIVSVSLFTLGGFLIDSFWCRYICPLGAISNTMKFWLWILGMTAIYILLDLAGVMVQWWMLLGAFCIAGYLLEVLHRRPAEQFIYMVKDGKACNHCGLCTSKCPYHIDVEAIDNGKVASVDCTLCGECAAVCKRDLLNVGFGTGEGYRWLNIFPAMLVVAIAAVGLWTASRIEIPTIDEHWSTTKVSNQKLLSRIVEAKKLNRLEITGLWSIKDVESSIKFKEEAKKVHGIYGVRTFATSHRAILRYDPAVIAPEDIYESLYVPTTCKISVPDPALIDSVKVITTHFENIYDPASVCRLSNALQDSGLDFFSIKTQQAHPMTISFALNPAESAGEKWLSDISRGLGYRLVAVENVETIGTRDYLWTMFSPFHGESEEMVESYIGWKQYIYEIADPRCDSADLHAIMPALWEGIAPIRGIIGVYLTLNKNLVPAVQVRYAWPLNAMNVQRLLYAEIERIVNTGQYDREIISIFKAEGIESRIYPQ